MRQDEIGSATVERIRKPWGPAPAALLLSIAIGFGAVASAAGSGFVPTLGQFVSIGQAGKADDQRLSQSVADLKVMVEVVLGEMAQLNARTSALSLQPPVEHHFTKLSADVTALKDEVAGLREARSATLTFDPLTREPIAGIEASLTVTRLEIDGLRASIDGRDESQRRELTAITQRLDRIETAVAGAEVTGSIGKTADRRRDKRKLR